MFILPFLLYIYFEIEEYLFVTLVTLLHFARQRSEGGAYRQTRVEAAVTVNSRAAKSTLASITWCVYSEV